MAYRAVVYFDDELVLDESAEVGEWIGLDGGFPHNVAVAFNDYGQEYHEDALLNKILADYTPANDVEKQQQATLIRQHVLGRKNPSVTFSYDDPGPRKKDGAPVRTNIERDLPSSFNCPVSAFDGDDPNRIHQFTVVVEEVV